MNPKPTTPPERSVGEAPTTLVLASASPRRAALLGRLGIPLRIQPADVKERPAQSEPAEIFVRRIAEEKARAVASGVESGLVIGADTVVVVDDEILGKPRDRDHARAMLRMLSGRTHSVISGIALITRPGERIASGADSSRVRFDSLSEDEIEWYSETGEADDKAGAYALQGLAALFIPEIMGSPSNVIGLPLSLLYRLSAEVGVDLRRLCGGRRPDGP